MGGGTLSPYETVFVKANRAEFGQTQATRMVERNKAG